jgi:hypothetical protein
MPSKGEISTVLWIGFFLFILITIVVRKIQVKNWSSGSSTGLAGGTPLRTQTAINKDLLYEAIIFLLFIIEIVLLFFAVLTIPVQFN